MINNVVVTELIILGIFINETCRIFVYMKNTMINTTKLIKSHLFNDFLIF